MLNRLSRLLAAACAALLPLLPLDAAAGSNAIVIGQAVDLSGPDGSLGRDYVAGIKTCFDMINAAGGINGRRISFIARDDRGQPELSARAATELIERDQVDYLMGGIGDQAARAVLSAPAFRRSGHILFAPLAAADYRADERVLFWRPSYKQEIRHIFEHFSKLGIAHAGIVLQDSPSNLEAYDSLTAEMRERHVRLAGSARIGAEGTDAARIAQEARRLAAARPGFVLVIADTIGTALFLKEYRKYDGQTFVAGTSLINLSTLRELAGARAVEWTVFSQVVPNPGAGASPLQIEHLNMMKKYRDEAVSSLTLEGFAAAKALAGAIRQARRGGNALQDFLAQSGRIDLGGLSVAASDRGNRLSGYVDIALFRKGSGLVF
ncbi:ABC transporter substrate-binding protein [Noviherbaspirillum sp. UKPF54]|uniref:ABC transporter substrate-binding protein n=1 Tax=Noviherbaspirillum sp. UKPF54 TaxID=2601898 RepID=UPI0011B13737|nr:ABC transporter substrate-binding protein [Noviherbaspirillum sp. UKPF54]QDZ28372.1 amino acid-binding protein [Noviherbaspirillum sp. UKPF54]